MKLIIISNRLPISIERTGNRKKLFKYTQSSGGLVTGLVSLGKTRDFLWVGNILDDDYTSSEIDEIEEECRERNIHPVFISKEINDLAYTKFSNEVLWPNLHYFCDRNTYDEKYYAAYKDYNYTFFKNIELLIDEGDKIWIQDYHLFLLPYYLRKYTSNRDIKIGFFLHTCFSDYDVIKNFPYLKAIVKGLLSADHIGVHDYEYKKAIYDCIQNTELNMRDLKILTTHFSRNTNLDASFSNIERAICKTPKYEIENADSKIATNILKLDGLGYKFFNRHLSIKVIPIGINSSIFTNEINKAETQKRINEIKEKFKNKFIILGVDRVDYIKGIPQRIKAIDLIMTDDKYKEVRENFVFIQIGVPSRENVEEYRTISDLITEEISLINSKSGDLFDKKIFYLNESINFQDLCALYKASDTCIISSLRDGMNLVCMEYVACQGENSKSTLLLSDFAGSVPTLPGSILFSPYCYREIADKIMYAFKMSDDEKVKRMKLNYENVLKFDAETWAERNFKEL